MAGSDREGEASAAQAERERAMAFARAWIEGWNRKDVEQVISHFAPDATFVSPKGARLTGSGTVRGTDELRAYWGAAVRQVGSIRFTLDYALSDAERRELCVVYVADLDGQRTRACEFMRFDSAWRQLAGEAMYGVAV